MSGIYFGLLMGCSGGWWKEIIQRIHTTAGNNSFKWVTITAAHPDINKSVLTRLKASNFLIKKKGGKSIEWIVNPEALSYIGPRSTLRKRRLKK